MRDAAHFVAALMALLGALGCDRGDVRFERAPAQIEPIAGGLRALISARGIETMYGDEGLELESPAMNRALVSGPVIQIGALSTNARIQHVEATIDTEMLTIDVSLNTPELIVPVRVGSGAEAIICRWQVRALQATASGVVRAEATASESLFAPVDPVVATLVDPQVAPIGACPLGTEERIVDQDDSTITLAAIVIRYVSDALADSLRARLSISLVDRFGFLDGQAVVSRRSAFSNRRGTLSVSSASSVTQRAASIEPSGLALSFDVASQVMPAPCAPPLDVESTLQGASPEPIDPASLQSARADVALSVSIEFIERLAQAAIKAGFACQGLESLGRSAGDVATSDLLLSEIAIPETLFGERAWLALSPGSLPTVAARPSQGVLTIGWDALEVEVYTDVFGAISRILKASADLSLTARPVALPSGELAMQLETITVRRAQIESDWRVEAVDEDALRVWVRRMMLLALGEQIDVPLPAMGSPALSLIEAQVRTLDVVLQLSLDEDTTR